MDFKLCSNEFFEVMGQSCICQYFDSSIDTILPHTHEFYEIFLVGKGSFTHKINGQNQVLSMGDLVLIRPQDRHYFKSQEHYIVYNFMFTRKVADDLFHYLNNKKVTDDLLNASFPTIIKLTIGEQEEFKNEFNKLNMLNSTNKDVLEICFRKFLVSVFSSFVVNYSKFKNNYPAWLDDTLTQMNLYENFTFGTKRFVELSGKSDRQLNRVLKKYLGVTSTEYVNDVRLVYVAKVLITSRQPVYDVFLDSGFVNIGHAYKLFHKKYGCTPMQYRKSFSSSKN